MVVGASLIKEVLTVWLGPLAENLRVFATAEELLGDAYPDFDLIVIGLCPGPPLAEGTLATIRGLCSSQGAPVIAFVSDPPPSRPADLLRAGVKGVVPITLPTSIATAALKLVLLGGTYAPPDMLLEPANASGEHPPPVAALFGLSPREAEVFHLLEAGQSNRLIASTLAISENTVMIHVRHLLRKMGAMNRTEAVYKGRKALQGGSDAEDTSTARYLSARLDFSRQARNYRARRTLRA